MVRSEEPSPFPALAQIEVYGMELDESEKTEKSGGNGR